MTVAVFGFLRFPAAAVAEILPHLHTLVEATRTHDRAHAYDVAEDIFEPGLMRFSELWPDSETLQQHLVAPHIARWREVCRTHGLIERHFTAYDATGARPI